MYKELVKISGGDRKELEYEYANMIWIANHVPDYDVIVNYEVARIISEVKENPSIWIR